MSVVEAAIKEHGEEIKGLRQWRHELQPAVDILNTLVHRFIAEMADVARNAAREAVELALDEREKVDADREERFQRRLDRGLTRWEKILAFALALAIAVIQLTRAHF